MNIEKEREAFEQHLTDTGLVEFAGYGFEVNECDEYTHEPTNIAWGAWQIGLNRATTPETEKLEGCVVVPVEPTDEWMENYIDSGVEKYCEQFIGQKFAVTEKEKPSIKEEWRIPVRKAHALVLKVVEAARGGNE